AVLKKIVSDSIVYYKDGWQLPNSFQASRVQNRISAIEGKENKGLDCHIWQLHTNGVFAFASALLEDFKRGAPWPTVPYIEAKHVMLWLYLLFVFTGKVYSSIGIDSGVDVAYEIKFTEMKGRRLLRLDYPFFADFGFKIEENDVCISGQLQVKDFLSSWNG